MIEEWRDGYEPKMTPNLSAFLTTISHSEGSNRAADPYRCCFAFRHTIQDLAYHPHETRPDGTREWKGETLTDEQCRNVGLSPGCISSAAGRYQITLPTFMRLRGILKTNGFGPEVQDDMCVQLIKECGALDLIFAGRISEAIALCHPVWASLPGSTAGQPITPIATLINAYGNAGGQLA
jgi:muramidase (phage lysozyme)